MDTCSHFGVFAVSVFSSIIDLIVIVWIKFFIETVTKKTEVFVIMKVIFNGNQLDEIFTCISVIDLCKLLSDRNNPRAALLTTFVSREYYDVFSRSQNQVSVKHNHKKRVHFLFKSNRLEEPSSPLTQLREVTLSPVDSSSRIQRLGSHTECCGYASIT